MLRLLPSLLALPLAHAGAPADRLPDPRPERCLSGPADLGEEAGDEPAYGGSVGLGYEQVVPVLQQTIQTALYCGQPGDRSEVHVTYELVVGCDGLVSDVQVSDEDGAPDDWLQCVGDVLRKADFPAHDMPDGMPVTYPVNFAW